MMHAKRILPLALAATLVAGTAAFAEDESGAGTAREAATPPGKNAEVGGQASSAAGSEAEGKPAPHFHVAEVAVCRQVEEHAPVNAGKSFPSDVGTLFCFTDVRDAGSARQIFHRWYVGDELVAEVPMQVKGPRWRCWSEKTILPGWSGPCHVEVATEEGDVLTQQSFTLAAAAQTPAGEGRSAQPDSTAGTSPAPETKTNTG